MAGEAPPPARPSSSIATRTVLRNLFGYHTPKTPEDGKKFDECRRRFAELALWIGENTDVSAEQTIAVRKLQDAMMATNACISLGMPLVSDPFTGERLQA